MLAVHQPSRQPIMKSLRAYLASKIPALHRVTSITQADVDRAQSYGPLHLFGVGTDIAWGSWGSRVPFITISSRTALALMQHQTVTMSHGFDTNGLGKVLIHVSLDDSAPIWALVLGAFLESVDNGHLQAAMVMDVARTVAAYKALTGLRAPEVVV